MKRHVMFVIKPPGKIFSLMCKWFGAFELALSLIYLSNNLPLLAQRVIPKSCKSSPSFPASMACSWSIDSWNSLFLRLFFFFFASSTRSIIQLTVRLDLSLRLLMFQTRRQADIHSYLFSLVKDLSPDIHTYIITTPPPKLTSITSSSFGDFIIFIFFLPKKAFKQTRGF